MQSNDTNTTTPAHVGSTAELGDSIPFKPETWPVDADGFSPDLCTECGTPVRYGSRHSACGRKVMGLPTTVERTVASIPDADLLRRAVRAVAQRRPKRKEFAWAAVSEVFGLGSTFSAQLCKRFGLDPDTGADIKSPNTEAEQPARAKEPR
jgi:hypothetical protein